MNDAKVTERFAFEILERGDRRIISRDQSIVDKLDLDAAALQAEYLESARISRFGNYGDAGSGPGRAEVGLTGYQRIDDLVRTLEHLRVNLNPGFFEQLFFERDVIGHGLHDRQPGDDDFFHFLLRERTRAGGEQ